MMTDRHPTPWTVVYDDNYQGWIKSASGEYLVGFGTDDKDFWEYIVATVNEREAMLAEIENLRAERDALKAAMKKANEILERNLGHQTEKCYDAVHVLRISLEKNK